MKILFIHNNYAKYSGEESVVDTMSALFEKHGHDISFYRPTSAGQNENISGKIHSFLSGIYSFKSKYLLRNKLKKERPHIVNTHNLYPFISPAALRECRKAKIPVVMTVHNYRLMCPTGLFMRNGNPCELCLKNKNEWNCLRYNCEHSFPKSLGYALRNMFSRLMKYYYECVDTFVCLTEFQKTKLIEARFDSKKIKVIPNGIDVTAPMENEIGKYVAYVGRLSEEKGYDLLFETALRHPEIPFHFAGSQRNLEYTHLPNNVHFHGHLDKIQLAAFIQKARFLVIPSRCYEGFPMTILEAAKQCKTIVGPNHGTFPEIIGQGDLAIGKLFTPCDIDSLEKKIMELWNHPEESNKLGRHAYEKIKREYDSEIVFRQWELLLEKLI